MEGNQKQLPSIKKGLTTHMILVVDRSGSMGGIQTPMQDAINTQLNEALKAGNTKVSVVEFDDVPVVCEWEVEPGSFEYKLEPRGWTAMLDGVGVALDYYKGSKNKYDTYLMIIISDGYENFSKKETYESIAAKIKDLTGTGKWTFSYVGANQDLSDISKKMNIPIMNTMNYAANNFGTQVMSAAVAGSTQSYFAGRAGGVTATTGFIDNSTNAKKEAGSNV